MYFNENVKHLLRKKGWRNADLAREIKISPQQAGKYVNGKHEPKMETLATFAKVFDVTIDDLVFTDLSQNEGRPFGGGIESAPSTDEQLILMNKLLLQRVQVLEREMKENNPELAKDLGIE